MKKIALIIFCLFVLFIGFYTFVNAECTNCMDQGNGCCIKVCNDGGATYCIQCCGTNPCTRVKCQQEENFVYLEILIVDIMKRKRFAIVTLFCLFIAICPLSGYSAGPDGFANVSWGASISQVSQKMAKQGFGFRSKKDINDGSIQITYNGTLAGTRGDLTFQFLNGIFYRGIFNFFSEDGGGAEREAYMKFLSIIQSKYGAPNDSGGMDNPYTGSYDVWKGLQVPGSSDKVQIALSYCATTERCGNSYCTSDFTVLYTNESLQQRLAGSNKDGL